MFFVFDISTKNFCKIDSKAKVNPRINPREIGVTNKLKPNHDNVTEVEAVAIITEVSTVSKEVVNTFHFSYLSFDLRFYFSK